MRRTASLLFALAIVAVAHLWLPRPASACSCAIFNDPMQEAALGGALPVFSGVVQDPEVDATPVLVTRWFQGPADQSIVGLDNRGFEDPMGGTCGIHRPPPGSEWIFVADTGERGLYLVGLCTTQGDLATPDGQRLLEQAQAVFGEPIVPVAPDRAAPEDRLAPSDIVRAGSALMDLVLPAALLLSAGLGVVITALVVMARREDSR